MKSYSESYKKAGVDVTAGYRAVDLMKKHIARTMTDNVLTGIGGFGGLYELDVTGMEHPVLVSGTDGVGTKLKIAFLMDRHNTIGIDCVAMCVNDIICCGAKPQFFLDYIALGKNVPEKVAEIVSGVAEGCVQAGCALVGGETAEMPGFYPVDEYDVAGFAVEHPEGRGCPDCTPVQRYSFQRLFSDSEGLYCEQPESGSSFLGTGHNTGRSSADADQDLCKADSVPAGTGNCKVYRTHHRRRIL